MEGPQRDDESHKWMIELTGADAVRAASCLPRASDWCRPHDGTRLWLMAPPDWASLHEIDFLIRGYFEATHRPRSAADAFERVRDSFDRTRPSRRH